MQSLIDQLLPVYDVRERHRTTVRAGAAAVYAAIGSTDLASTPAVRALLFARAIPGAILAGRAGLRELRRRLYETVTLRAFERHGFRIIAEFPPDELVIGVEGQFWRLRGGVCTPAPEHFRSVAPAPGTARAVWNFTVRPAGASHVELATETRVQCADAAARRRFLPYWLVIRAGSGLIRRQMLRAIRRAAESGSPGVPDAPP
jgi:hypothetical protein